MILAVDLSLNSTGLCLRDDVGNYTFGACINLNSFSSRKVPHTLDELYMEQKFDFMYRMSKLPGVKIYAHNRPTEKPNGFLAIGQRRLRDASKLPIIISKNIDDMIDHAIIDHVGIEDYSMGSATDNLIQVAEITSVLKSNHLIQLLSGNTERFYTIPGPSIKMLAGKGNFQKDQMLNAFLNDPDVKDNPLRIFLSKNLESVTKLNVKKGRMDVHSPVNDMIDAYWTAKYVHEVIVGGKVLVKAKAPKIKKAKA